MRTWGNVLRGVLTAAFGLGAVVLPGTVAALDSVFTYQGRLTESGAPPSGPVNLAFRLYDAASAGEQVGSELLLVGFDEFAAGGEFTVELDFGANAFTGEARWLEVWVGGTLLSPRQPVRPTPYALHAMNAATVLDGGLSATYASAVDFTNPGNSFTGDGGGLTNLGWGNLAGVPPGFADGQDNDTIVWSTNGFGAYYDTTGSVGIGTDNPISKLEVLNTAPGRYAVWAVNESDHASWDGGVYGKGADRGGSFETTSSGFGVVGLEGFAMSATASQAVGVYGESKSSSGTGVRAVASSGSGLTYGIRSSVDSPSGYAGHFTGGQNYFQGNVGIGVDNPISKLEVLNTAPGRYAVWAVNESDHASWDGGVYGKGADRGGSFETTSSGFGVVGLEGFAMSATASQAVGVYGESKSSSGTGVRAVASSGSGLTYGIRSSVDSPSGYAGHFTGGQNYFQGKVGIGTLSPASALHIEGAGFPNAFIILNATDAAGDAGLRLNRQGAVQWHVFNSGSSDLLGIHNAAFAPVIAATQAGNVGIGMTNPAYQLQLSLNSAAKPTSGSWTIASDQRLKKDIRTIEGALDDLLRLHGVTYRWIDPQSQGGMDGVYNGLIAQEVEQVFPAWVHENTDGYKTLTVIGFEGLVVEALRELQLDFDARVRAEAASIATLRGENAELRRRLAALETTVANLAQH